MMANDELIAQIAAYSDDGTHRTGLLLKAAQALAAQDARIAELEAEVARLREILTFDCTGYPAMEDAAIKWANKISGPKGGKSFHPDPIGILELCEDVASQALAQIIDRPQHLIPKVLVE